MHDWTDIPTPVFDDPSNPDPTHPPDPQPPAHSHTKNGKPIVNNGPFSNKELTILQKAYLEDQMTYRQIAELLPGRSQHSIRQKIYSMKWQRLRAKISNASKCLVQTNDPTVDQLAFPRRNLVSGQAFLEATAAGAQEATARALELANHAFRPQDINAALAAVERGVKIYRVSMGLDPDNTPGNSGDDGGVLSMDRGAPKPVKGTARTV